MSRATVASAFEGGRLTYDITIEDVDGNSTVIEGQPIDLPSRPNLTIHRPLNATEPSISYDYSPELQALGVSVQVDNGSATEPLPTVKIVAFGSDPDREGPS